MDIIIKKEMLENLAEIEKLLNIMLFACLSQPNYELVIDSPNHKLAVTFALQMIKNRVETQAETTTERQMKELSNLINDIGDKILDRIQLKDIYEFRQRKENLLCQIIQLLLKKNQKN